MTLTVLKSQDRTCPVIKCPVLRLLLERRHTTMLLNTLQIGPELSESIYTTLNKSSLTLNFPSPNPSLSYYFSAGSSSTSIPPTPSSDDPSFYLTPSTLSPHNDLLQILENFPIPSPSVHPNHKTSRPDGKGKDVQDENQGKGEDYIPDTEEASAWYEFDQILTTSSHLTPLLSTSHSHIRGESTTVTSSPSNCKRNGILISQHPPMFCLPI